MNEQLFAVWWSFKTKETNTALYLNILNILLWLRKLHFHQLVSFAEDINAAILMFSFFTRGRSQPTESLVAIYYRRYNFSEQKVS